MSSDLQGQLALVTGAARGIGRHIAERLARDGCRVVLTDLDAAAVQRAATDLGELASALAMDVRDRHAITVAVERVVGEHGAIDILVNNAGLLAQGPFHATDGAAWDDLLATNVSGVYHCVQAVAPSMAARGRGNILNVASVSAARGGGSVGNVWYGATKAAVVAMTQGLARELGPKGVRVNAISPAVVDTDMMKPHLDDRLRDAITTRIPLGRLAQRRDVGELAAWLVSDAAAFVTGQNIAVDGGLLCT